MYQNSPDYEFKNKISLFNPAIELNYVLYKAAVCSIYRSNKLSIRCHANLSFYRTYPLQCL